MRCIYVTAAPEFARLILYEELKRLLVHGILHLAGYDHERSGDAAARRMEKKEREIFALLQGEGLV